MIRVLTLCLVYAAYLGESKDCDVKLGPPKFPEQFSAQLVVTAHGVDPQLEYPPAVKHMWLRYDRPAGLAIVDVKAGLDAGKMFVRRYDQKREYMIRGGEYPVCRRSYLGEEMPPFEVPTSSFHFEGMVSVRGVSCHHWLLDDRFSAVHVYTEEETELPLRLTEEAKMKGSPPVPLMTYDFYELNVGAQAMELFELPSPYTHDTCEFHVGGFPYIHAFHHYLRF